jgi:hypothetical protein
MVGKELNDPAQLHHWAVVDFCQAQLSQTMINNGMHALQQCCARLGDVIFPQSK